MGTIFSAVKEMFREASVALGMDLVFNRLKREGTHMVAEKIKKKLNDESRAEMLSFIRELAVYDPIASRNLLRRQLNRQNEEEISYKKPKKGDPEEGRPGEKYSPGSEDDFVTLLTKLYIALNDDAREKHSRIETFLWLGRMSDKKFDATLEFLRHDVVLQYIRKLMHITEMTFMELKSLVEKLGANEALLKLDASGAKKLREFRRVLNAKGVRR